MAYSKTKWIDRVVQFPRRFLKSGETSSEVTLTAHPGTVTEEGTLVGALHLNKLEDGLEKAAKIADDALPKTGGEMTGNLILNNGIILMGKDTLGTARTLIMHTVDGRVVVGAAAVPLMLQTSVDPVVQVGGVSRTLYHTGNDSTLVSGQQRGSTQVGDFNTVAKSGFYFGLDAVGTPQQGWFFVEHITEATGTWAIQRAWNWHDNTAMFVRRRTDGGWQPWERMLHAGNISTTTLSRIAFNSAEGDKIRLYGDTFGFAINGAELTAYLPPNCAFRLRETPTGPVIGLVWHSGNDGNGSGLDADVLRGYAPATNIIANSIAQRDGGGGLQASAFWVPSGEVLHLGNKPYITGFYTGNNATNRHISVGFDPVAVILFPSGIVNGSGTVQQFTNQLSGLAVSGNSVTIGSNVLSVVAGGFLVNGAANNNSHVFNYIAFK